MNPADYPFLPAWPPALTPLAWVAVLLLTAIVVGEATRRWLRISRVVGYLLVGAVLGPHATGVLSADTLATLRIFSDIAVGLLLFELGQRVGGVLEVVEHAHHVERPCQRLGRLGEHVAVAGGHPAAAYRLVHGKFSRGVIRRECPCRRAEHDRHGYQRDARKPISFCHLHRDLPPDSIPFLSMFMRLLSNRAI